MPVLATLDYQSSVSVMLLDLESNNVEICWSTGLNPDRLQASPMDLDRPEAELMHRFQTRLVEGASAMSAQEARNEEAVRVKMS